VTRTLVRTILAAALAAQLAPALRVQAQEDKEEEAEQQDPAEKAAAAAARNLDQLLKRVRSARAREAQAEAAREKEFLAARDQQARLLTQAKRQRDAAEARSKQLSEQFDTNERELNALAAQLRTREGNLGELFGVTRQVAGDTFSVLRQSLISAQFPGREEFLADIAGSKALPSITELERLWFEMLREMVESGRVTRFPTTISQPDGTAREAEVVRVGPFMASTGGRYLSFSPGQGLAMLARRLPPHLTSLAEDLDEADNGYVEAAIDPSRGVLLDLYVERPNWLERIQRGELVGYVIITVGIIGALVAAYQAAYLLRTRVAVRRQLQDLKRPTADNPLGRVLLAFRGNPDQVDEDAAIVELRISEAVLREVPLLERFQAFLRLAVAAGPLLGLIGTVVGMIITFQSITESGSSDPRLMARGIGQAMIATVLGLGIAIPLLFINAGLASMSRQVIQILDEQSTGLLAERLEAGARRPKPGERSAVRSPG
jgi:biopolymer transport protein ExbB